MDALYLNDQIMEFDLTPNRADALSMVGTAYEVSALYDTKMTKPETNSNEETNSAMDELQVTVKIVIKFHTIVLESLKMSLLHHRQYGCKHV